MGVNLSERLEAACGRALAIGNPTYKSVNAILKNGLEKVGLVEEVEPEGITHENIRGGEYFDREEVKQASNDDRIESRYLDEERFAIMNEPSSGVDRQAPGSGRAGERPGASNQVVVSAPRFVATEPLPALLGRLQALWTRPRPMVQIGRQTMACRGSDNSQSVEGNGLSCASRTECVIDDGSTRVDVGSRGRSVMLCEATYESDDEWASATGPRRGEMG